MKKILLSSLISFSGLIIPYLSSAYQPTNVDRDIINNVESHINQLEISKLNVAQGKLETVLLSISNDRIIYVLEEILILINERIDSLQEEIELDNAISSVFEGEEISSDIYIGEVKRLLNNLVISLCMKSPAEGIMLDVRVSINGELQGTKGTQTINNRLKCYAVSRPIVEGELNSGPNEIQIIADYNNKYKETDEDNNEFTENIVFDFGSEEEIIKEGA